MFGAGLLIPPDHGSPHLEWCCVFLAGRVHRRPKVAYMTTYQPTWRRPIPEVSANSSCRRPTVCAVGDPPEPGFLFVDRGLGGSRFVLLAGRRRAGVVNRGRGILLSSAVAEYAGRHGCVSLGQGQPHR